MAVTVPALAQERPADASNFYQSDKVDVRKVTFKNQYRMDIAGNLFLPKGMDAKGRHAAIIRGASYGRGEGAEREPLRRQDGGTGLRCTPVR
ncbi:MAG: hypothetical protein V8Q84_06020 [Bilophila sp.]